MTVGDIVKVTQYLVRPEDIPAYVRVRSEVLGSAPLHAASGFTTDMAGGFGGG